MYQMNTIFGGKRKKLKKTSTDLTASDVVKSVIGLAIWGAGIIPMLAFSATTVSGSLMTDYLTHPTRFMTHQGKKLKRQTIFLMDRITDFFTQNTEVNMKETDKAFYFYKKGEEFGFQLKGMLWGEEKIIGEEEQTITLSNNKTSERDVNVFIKDFHFLKQKLPPKGTENNMISMSYKGMPILQKVYLNGESNLMHYIKATDLISLIPHMDQKSKEVKQVRIAKPEVLSKYFETDKNNYLKRRKEIVEKIMKRTKTKWKSVMAFKKGKKPGYDPLPFHSQIIEKDHPVYGKLRY